MMGWANTLQTVETQGDGNTFTTYIQIVDEKFLRDFRRKLERHAKAQASRDALLELPEPTFDPRPYRFSRGYQDAPRRPCYRRVRERR